MAATVAVVTGVMMLVCGDADAAKAPAAVASFQIRDTS